MQILIRLGFLLILLFSSSYMSSGQHTPFNPISYRVLCPSIFNPAITGSKDYTSFNFITGLEGESKSQILTADTRLAKKLTSYFTAPILTGFSNIGIGGSLFNDLNGLSKNTGLNGSFSYHISLNKENLSFLSFGVSVKAVYNALKPGLMDDSILIQSEKNTFFANVDIGSYYYGTNFYAGFSLTNLLGNPEKADISGVYAIPVSLQYFFFSGYKFLIYKPLNIVLEPSFIINTDKLNYQEITDNIEPVVKIYLQDFCLGTYFNDKKRTSFFFQYRFPMINIGAFFDFPRNTAYYKKEVIVEINAGINLIRNQNRFNEHSRW